MIDWKAHGFFLAATALNGTQALKQVQKYHPDILITDVKMPGMTGLELVEKLHVSHPDLKILMLSSYDEFDYVKKAIHLGVSDYILKNEITAAFLTQKLLELSADIRHSAKINTVLLEKNLTSYFLGASDSEETPPIQGQYYFFAAALQTPFCKSIRARNAQLRQNADYILSCLEQQEPFSASLHFSHENFVLLWLRAEVFGKDSRTSLSIATRSLWQRLAGSAKHFCCVFYYPHSLTVHKFRELYFNAFPLLLWHTLFSTGDTFNMEDLLLGKTYTPLNRAFSFRLLDGDEQHLPEQTVPIKEYIYACRDGWDPGSVLNFYESFCIHMDILSEGRVSLEEPRYFWSIEELLKWIFDTYRDCIIAGKPEDAGQLSPSVRMAVHYMEQNYSDSSLTAERIARAVALSSGRLGIAFKRETNRTINEYLTELRVRQAVYFLQNTNMKIYEISEKCGYKSSQYFSSVFCTHTGKRPIDYRRK